LIAYFIGNISAKKISKSIHVRQNYSKPKVGRFFETWCTCICCCNIHDRQSTQCFS